jgi:hypothetical protein
VEPFQIRCETCRARLRVNDERFVGQIHACPKCGSMVQIAVPPELAAAAAAVMAKPSVAGGAPLTALSTASSAAPASKLPIFLTRLLHSPAAVWSASAIAVVSLAGLGAAVALRSANNLAIHQDAPPAVAAAVAPATTSTNQPSNSGVCQGLAAAMDEQAKLEFAAESAAGGGDEPTNPAVAVADPSAATATLPPTTASSADAAPAAQTDPAAAPNIAPHKLTLEPVAASATPITPPPVDAAAPSGSPKYPPVADPSPAPDRAAVMEIPPRSHLAATASADEPAARPVLRFGQAPNDAARRTNLSDQFSLPVASFDMADAPLTHVLDMLANMAAVPITCDPATLAAAHIAPDMHVTVHAHDTTLGKLLGGLLREHGLSCEPRDGQVVITAHSSDTN